ncbi:MAG TPA: transposase, partial [Streptosporangiaceae bacterium]|nr:transposase [Streptosporangiaceae bacterium]
MAWDGTGIDVPGTAVSAAAFGGPAGGGPQLRLLTLIECGTRALIDAALDGFARASEQVLARRLLHALQPGMLLLADRGFPGYELRGLAAATGAHLAWRVRSSAVLTPVRYLPDGSYLPVLPTPHDARQGWKLRARGRPQAGHRIRVIPCSVTVTAAGGTTRTETFRPVTTLLDPQQAPAADLAALYHQRREAETGYGDLKTRLRGAGFILRARIPDLACPEMRAFLAVFRALPAMECQAAAQAGIDPDRISFTVAIRIARDHARTQQHALTPRGLARTRRHA